jgi:hypothetical protein
MMARLLAPLGRLATMDAEEVRFRVRGEVRKAADRVRVRLGNVRWDRSTLTTILSPSGSGDSTFLAAARDAARDGDWPGSHCALARHLVHRPAAFPLSPLAVATVAAQVRGRFPSAAREARARAERLAAGDYDILGYRGLHVGVMPDWHADPVHQRRAPGGFWADVPYLDPGSGDHKIIWEINRHQHWLALGRAYALDGDRQSYSLFVAQLRSWLDANPPLTGVNWASMLELAFRALSWLWAAHVFAPAAAEESDAAEPWIVDLLIGLDRQLAHIVPNLSRYFSPNTHLTGEALALYVAGLSLPFLRGSRHWADIGREVLVAEATRQVHADGGHAELSAHYHRYSTDFYLLALQVARAAGDPAADIFEDTSRRQAAYLRAIADDSGRIPLLGDDDGGQLFPVCGREPDDCRDTLGLAAVLLEDAALAIGDVPEEVLWRNGGRIPPETWARGTTLSSGHSRAFPSTGYFVSRTRSGDHLVFDTGAHGFLNGGHAHADALSLVVSVGGRPLIVDPGTATYTMDPAVRDRFRSTAMHNTVLVNGLPQSQPRGPFHWRTRTDARRGTCRIGDHADYAEGRHAAYAPIAHVRGVLALHDVAWFVVDHFIAGPGAAGQRMSGEPLTTDAFWHLHPDWTLTSRAGASVSLQHRDGQRQHLACSGMLGSVRGTRWSDLAAYAPCYGRVVPAECLRMAESGPAPRSMVTIIPMGRRAEAAISVQPLPLTTPPAEGWYGAAWRVRLDDTELVLLAASEREASPHELAAPPVRWGTADIQVVSRVALLAMAPDGWRAVLVNGRHLSGPGIRINHDMARPLIELDSRAPGAPYLAVNLRGEPSW